MSNPGVITLNSKKIDLKKSLYNERFVIEDNIGEAIHIHYRNMRFDFSIEDYIEFSDGMYASLPCIWVSHFIITNKRRVVMPVKHNVPQNQQTL